MAKKKYIETPSRLWDLFCEYKVSVKGNPFKVKDWVGKEAEQVNREKERPLTMAGFQNYLEEQGEITDITDYFENKEGRYAEYVRICSRVKRNIRQDQIEGGMVGIYNPSITQRLNSLTDKQEVQLPKVGIDLEEEDQIKI